MKERPTNCQFTGRFWMVCAVELNISYCNLLLFVNLNKSVKSQQVFIRYHIKTTYPAIGIFIHVAFHFACILNKIVHAPVPQSCWVWRGKYCLYPKIMNIFNVRYEHSIIQFHIHSAKCHINVVIMCCRSDT